MAGGRRPKAQETFPIQMTFRLSQELRDQLGEAAGDRAVGDEIRERLEASFAADPPRPTGVDPEFADVLAAIGHAAAFVGRLPVVEPGDTTRYVVFADAVSVLLSGFEPEGQPQISQNRRNELCGRLTGVVLALLGDRGEQALAKLMNPAEPEAEKDKP